MKSVQNSLDTRFNSLATTTSVDNVVQTLRDMRLEAANDRNAQMDNIRKQINICTGRFNPELSQQVLDSIGLLNSKIKDHSARSRTNTTQDTSIPSPVSRPADSGSSSQDQSAIQRVEGQLAAQTHLLQLLIERDVNPQSSGSLPEIQSNGITQSAQDTIRQSIQVTLSFFRAGVKALLLKLWIALPVIQHILRTLRALPLLVSTTISDSILFEDALGRIVHLPYVHFRHYAVFMARLRCEFKNVPGEQKVLLEQFRIFRRKRFDEFLTKDNWDSAVRPGSKVAMSILLDNYGSEGDTCPRCETIKADTDAKDLSQWYVPSPLSKLTLTNRSTVCGLSWTLQKFNPSDTLSSADRVHGATSRPLLERGAFEMAENESSSSSESSPNLSEVAVPLAFDKDIESFTIVHIQSQNASALFWQPSGSRNLTVELALRRTIQRAARPWQGSIYLFWREDFPQILKIGYTTNGVEKRLQDWSRLCRREYASDLQLYKETEMTVPFVYQVERLIHTELKNYRMRIECTGCGKYHFEWFCVSKGHAFKVFQKWKAWTLLEPYMQTDCGEWVLKPSFLADASEICRPLTMED